jgi:hypothetical protein
LQNSSITLNQLGAAANHRNLQILGRPLQRLNRVLLPLPITSTIFTQSAEKLVNPTLFQLQYDSGEQAALVWLINYDALKL